MHKPITKVTLIKGGNIIKQGHDFTLEFNLFDGEGNLVDLTGSAVTYKIAQRAGGVVHEGTAQILGEGRIGITVTEDVGYGDRMRVEFTSTVGGKTQKFPADDFLRLKITPSLDNLGYTDVNTITVEQFQRQFDDMDAKVVVAVDKAEHAEVVAEGVRDQFDAVIAEAGSNNPEVVQARGGEVNLNARLDKVNQQLAEKANDAEVRKKSVLIGESDVSDTLKQQINGNAPILQTLADDIITERKASFVDSRNIYDKDSAESGYLLTADGTVRADETWRTSDYIKVNHGDTINTSLPIGGYAFYTVDYSFISAVTGVNVTTLSVPSGAYYMRIHLLATRNNTLTVVKNEVAPSYYIPFQWQIQKDLIKGLDKSAFENFVINANELGFLESVNLFDKTKTTAGQYVSYLNGSLLASAGFTYSDFIEVIGSGRYIRNNINQHFSWYDANKIYIANPAAPQMTPIITAPENAKYLRVSVLLTNLDTQMLVKGDTLPSTYAPYQPVIPSKYLSSKPVDEEGKENLLIDLPNKIYAVEGKPLNIYFDNIIHEASEYNIDVISARGIHYDKRVGSLSGTPGELPITIEAYDGQKRVASKGVTLKTVSTTNGSGTKNVLFIGDSTTNAGKYTQALLDSFVGDSMNVQLFGTRGTTPNLHEGRSGWSGAVYTKSASLAGTTNAFWNPTTSKFDFAYYMNQQGYSSLDYVFIHLGINDIFNYATVEEAKAGVPSILAHFETIIASIKAFSSTIRIALMVTIPPNATQTAFGSAYGAGQTRWRYKAVYHEWLRQFIAKYDNRELENLYLVPIHAQLNTESHISDAVHPNDAGYDEMSKPIYYFLKNLG